MTQLHLPTGLGSNISEIGTSGLQPGMHSAGRHKSGHFFHTNYIVTFGASVAGEVPNVKISARPFLESADSVDSKKFRSVGVGSTVDGLDSTYSAPI